MTKNSERNDYLVIFIVMMIGAVIGYSYTYAVYLSAPDAQGSAWTGIAIGSSIAGLSSIFELIFIAKPQSKIRVMPFLASFIIRLLTHVLIIVLVIFVVQLASSRVSGTPLFMIEQAFRNTMTDIIFSFIVMSVVVFQFQMRNFIGGKTLNNLMIGRYHQPQIEERVFMIIDIVGSTQTAEKIGDTQFHQFLNEMFIMFDGPIHRYGGEVHSYVGDAVLAVWPLHKKKSKNARVLHALKAINEICIEKEQILMEKFGIHPEIHAAIHAGPVAMGEMGFRKRQITYLGNTLNQTFRLEGLAKHAEVENSMVVSAPFLEASEIPDGMQIVSLGMRALKGAKDKLEVCSISMPADQKKSGLLI